MKISFLLILLLAANLLVAQNDSLVIEQIYSNALNSEQAYNNLRILSTEYPGRLCGTEASINALKWAEKEMHVIGADTVYKQHLVVKSWKRGKKEVAIAYNGFNYSKKLHVCALGNSVSTPETGIKAPVLEVISPEQIKTLKKEDVSGCIVFINQALNQDNYYTFRSYGESAWQRTRGAAELAPLGALAVVSRSLTLATDTFPHTGVMRYKPGVEPIPAFSVATEDAEYLKDLLAKSDSVELYLKSSCYTEEEQPSYNLIAEIVGSEYPDQIITVGGHIDCWDNSPGAHDDGAGCVQSMDVIRIFKDLGIKPKHTIRVVLFMDEEMNQCGAKKYAEIVDQKKEHHLAAIESDRGGLVPVGFSMDLDDTAYVKVLEWKSYFEKYGLWQFSRGGTGVDIGPLKNFGVSLFALMPESQRYFDYHHSANDSFDKVNRRELQLGTASIAALIYLIDLYGLH